MTPEDTPTGQVTSWDTTADMGAILERAAALAVSPAEGDSTPTIQDALDRAAAIAEATTARDAAWIAYSGALTYLPGTARGERAGRRLDAAQRALNALTEETP